MEPIFSGPGLVEPIFFKTLWAKIFTSIWSYFEPNWLNLLGAIRKIVPLSQKDSSFLELPKIEPSSAFKDMWLASQILSQA